MNREELKQVLPHREPMLLVDEAFVNEDHTATAYYTVKGNEFFLQGHFPGNPIVPGVIQCEIMAQAACVLFGDRLHESGKLPVYTGLEKIRFKEKIRPGDKIRVDISVVREHHPLYFLKGKLSVDGKLCMQGEFSFAIANV